MSDQHDLSKDTEYRTSLLCRCSELESLIFAEQIPDRESATLYFKYHQILNEVFKIGVDYSLHPRNPWNPNCTLYGTYGKKSLDKIPKSDIISTMNEKEAKRMEFLENTIATLKSRVMTSNDPLMTDRMTFFAYANYLRHQFHRGEDFSNHPRNPWQGTTTPLNFNDYSQIRQWPKELGNEKAELSKTQVIPALKTPLLPTMEMMHRVFDKTIKSRTVYQGTEGKCYDYVKRANIDCGAELFDYEATSVKNFTPNSGSSHVRFEPSPCCAVALPPRKKTPKEMVAEYLKRTNTQIANEPTTTTT